MSALVLSTPRMVLREMTPADEPFVAAMLGDPEVMRYYPPAVTQAGARRWIDRQLRRYSRDGHGLWLCEDRTTGEPIGQVGITMQQVGASVEPELGYLIHRPHWRRGFASEAGSECLDWAFKQLRPLRVVSLILAENLPSQGVARSLGLQRAGETLHAGLPHLVYQVRAGDPRP